MQPQGVQRKLTAILSADVKGYSRLMADDEVATVRTLTAYREVMAGLVQQHQGRVVDSPGDNVMAEFASVVDAVQCAVEIQRELKARNADLAENRKMEFRIGINLGDVIVEGEGIYGDGVNIAARVEGLSEGGGIAISGTVYDQVRNKLELGYEFLGEQSVKNIAEPVRVYRAHWDPDAEVSFPLEERKPEPEKAGPRGLGIGAAGAVAAALLVAGGWYLLSTQQRAPVVQQSAMTTKSVHTPEAAKALTPPMRPLEISMGLIAQRAGDPAQIVVKEGDSLRFGDRFRVKYETSDVAYVYVLLLDSQGKTTQLFPDPKIHASNKASGGQKYQVPTGSLWLGLDEIPGVETVFVLASREPLPNVKDLVASLNEVNSEYLSEHRLARQLIAQAQPRRGVSGLVQGESNPTQLADTKLIRRVTEAIQKEVSAVRAVSFLHQ